MVGEYLCRSNQYKHDYRSCRCLVSSMKWFNFDNNDMALIPLHCTAWHTVFIYNIVCFTLWLTRSQVSLIKVRIKAKQQISVPNQVLYWRLLNTNVGLFLNIQINPFWRFKDFIDSVWFFFATSLHIFIYNVLMTWIMLKIPTQPILM